MDYRFVYGDLDPSNTTVNEVHRIISDAAAEIANRNPEKDPRFMFKGASYASERTDKGTEGICIEWDPAQLHKELPDGDTICAKMEGIGIQAVKDAIHANQELFVGLILGEARQGRDYFEHFNG